MAKIHDSIMSLIKPGRIATAATTLGESDHKISAATDIILPSLLASMLKKGDSPEIEEVLKEGKKIKAWENIDKIWQGSGVDEHINLGERMENRVLGQVSSKLNTAVAHKVGFERTGEVDRLTNWVAGTVAAAFAQHIGKGASYKELLGELAGEKEALRRAIPADIINDLGLGHTLGVADGAAHSSTHAAAARPATASVREPVKIHPVEPKKGSLAWLWWLLGLIVLALICFWCFRSCAGKRMKAIEAVPAVTQQVVTEVKTTSMPPKFEAIPMVLPDGTKITMYKGNLESAVKAYLDSDKFKNATDAELRSVWFEFSDIDFEHNSATELMPASKPLLEGLVNTLKNYPNVKIKIGAFGDKTGNRAVNYAISEARALNIEKALETAGCPAASVSVEGFGKEFAKVPATASNDERAPDRDIAMRFTR
jgi:outer membrane protein OmpA-like peptidoglycan-associated protein